MFESETRYWPRCDRYGAAGPMARTARDAWEAAQAAGWRSAEGRTPVVKAALWQTLCPACADAQADTEPPAAPGS